MEEYKEKLIRENHLKNVAYDILLDEVEEDIINLKLEKEKVNKEYQKNKKRTNKIMRNSCIIILTITYFIASIIILDLNLVLPSIIGMLISTSAVFISYKNLLVDGDIYKDLNELTIMKEKKIDYELDVLQGKQKTIENSSFVRSILDAIITKTYISSSEVKKLQSIIASNELVDDFNIKEMSVIDYYLNNYTETNNTKETNKTYNNSIIQTEELEKGYQKRLK